MSYLSRHRPICSVLDEIKQKTTDPNIIPLIDEAIDYARRMSKRLMEYKQKEQQNADT